MAAPIPDSSASAPTPAFIGKTAEQHPLYAPPAPRHPFMAANERSNIHNDAYMTDTNVTAGPLGRGVSVRSALLEGVCGSVTFDSKGRIVTVCVGLEGAKARAARPQDAQHDRDDDAAAAPGREPLAPSTTSPAAATSTSTSATAP